MSLLCIETKGYVCLPFPSASEPDLLYDIPRDSLGFPFLPFSALPDAYHPFKGFSGVGFGTLRDLDSLIFAIDVFGLYRNVFPRFVSDRFTEIRTVLGRSCRVLKPGLTFLCTLDVPEDSLAVLKETIGSIRQIGITDPDVTGEVSIGLKRDACRTPVSFRPAPEQGISYRRLHYSIRLITPLCSYRPYDRSEKGDRFIPGTLMLHWIKARLGDRYPAFASEGILHCANAYLSIEGQRSFPPASCMMRRRYEKSVLEYRLSARLDDVSQTVVKPLSKQVSSLSSTVLSCDHPKMKISFLGYPEAPELSGWGNRRFTLREHQVFRGFFEGTDAQIRMLSDLIASEGHIRLGDYTEEGFGESIIRTVSFDPDDGKVAAFQKEFDVILLSDAVFYNQFGCPDASQEAFLSAVEDVLHAKGKLFLISASMQTGIRYAVDVKAGTHRSCLRCVCTGSCLRLAVRDDVPIDIAPLQGAFIGDKTGEGLGEIIVLPSQENLIRRIRGTVPEGGVVRSDLTNSQMLYGATFARDVSRDLMRYNVSLLAANDAKDASDIEDEILRLILGRLKTNYDDSVDFETMKQWYRESLELHRT